MFFSIIIPAYNASKYLSECLASVSCQTYEDYEVVIVDDGSTDETSSIVDSYAESNANVRVIHQKNEGLLLARRVGLKAARGNYVVFLDSDDCLHPEALHRIHEVIMKTEADIVSFRYSRSRDLNCSDTPSPLPAGLYSDEKYVEARNHLCSGRFNEMWSKVVRRILFDTSADYSVYGRLMHGEDLLQMLPVFDNAHSLFSMNDVLYFYRPNDSASTASYKTSQLSDIRIVNHVFRDYAEKWGGICYQSACAGEAMQYINLLKIAVSESEYSVFSHIFLDVRTAVLKEECFSHWKHCRLRPDNKLTVFLLKHGFSFFAFALLKTVDFAKNGGWR